MPKVVGIGELLWDILPGGKKLGGAPANFAFHSQALGVESRIVSSIGNDDLGNEMKNCFQNLKLRQDFIQVNKKHQTGVVNVLLNDGIPEYEIKIDVAWDFIQWNSELRRLAETTDAVCFGSLAQRSNVSRLTILEFLKSTRPDCERVFDINLRQHFYTPEIIKKSLEFASVLKLNDEELLVVAELFLLNGTEEIVLQQLIETFNLDMVVLTKGSEGSLLMTGNEKSFLTVPKVQVIDTVGAGDSFTAALIIAKLYGKQLSEMHNIANEVAAFVCSQMGATPIMPEELKNKVR